MLFYKINNVDSYLYLENDLKYMYYGYNIDSNGISLLSKDILFQIYDLIKMNNNCIYIKDYNDYKAYYDKNNNFLHYIKNGKEDFNMFFLNNGVDAISYSASRLKTRKEIKRFEFIDKGLQVVTCLAMCTVIGLLLYVHPASITELEYDTRKVLGLSVDQINTQKAFNYIYDSESIDDDVKKFLYNENFLNDVISHYDDKMLYTANFKFKDININDFSDWEYPGAAGIYNCINMNSLNVLNTIEDKSDYWYNVLAHEFVHLMQTDIKLKYIMESSAELISAEYFDQEVNSYQESVSNLKLLVETVGPEVLWNLNFSSDDTTFDKILKDNLSGEEYLELISELSLSPFYDEPDHEIIKALIEILYKNMYGIDMKDNRNIYNFYGNHIEKFVYFDQNNDFSIVGKYSFEEALRIGMVKKGDIYRYEREISADEYYNFYENVKDKDPFAGCYASFDSTNKTYEYNHSQLHFNEFICSDNEIRFTSDEGIGILMSVREALDKGYIKDSANNIIDQFVTTNEPYLINLPVGNYTCSFDSTVVTEYEHTLKEANFQVTDTDKLQTFIYY